MYTSTRGYNAAEDARTKSEMARAALENFVPPGYEPETPVIDFEGALHVRYEVPVERLRAETEKILRSMEIAGSAEDPAALSVKTESGLSLAFQPVMDEASVLTIAGVIADQPSETGANFEILVAILQHLRNRLPEIEAEIAAPPMPSYAPIPADNAWIHDIGGAMALLESAGFDVLTKYPRLDTVDLQIRRNFSDMESFIAFARSIAMPARTPTLSQVQGNNQRQSHSGSGVIETHTARKQRPWVLIALAILAIAAVFFYPWQQ